MPKILVLNDKDRQLLEELLRDKRQGRLSTPLKNLTDRQFVEGEDHQAPEVYVAKTKEVIPALSADVPGKGDCDIYQIFDDGTDPELIDIGLVLPVYNISNTEVGSEEWIKVSRIKHGYWLADSVGQGFIWGKITDRTEVDLCPDTANDAQKRGGYSWVEIEWDEEGCPSNKSGGRSGEFNAYEQNDSNATLDVSGNNIVKLYPVATTSSSGSDPGGVTIYIFDKGLTDEDQGMRELLT